VSAGLRRRHERSACARREYRLPVKDALNNTAGEHTLKILISPAPDAAQASASAYPYKVPGAAPARGAAPLWFAAAPHRPSSGRRGAPPRAANLLSARPRRRADAAGRHVLLQLHSQARLRLWLGLVGAPPRGRAPGSPVTRALARPAGCGPPGCASLSARPSLRRGPAFAPSGLYGVVQLQAYNTAIITGALPRASAIARRASLLTAPCHSLRLTHI